MDEGDWRLGIKVGDGEGAIPGLKIETWGTRFVVNEKKSGGQARLR
jgi:hypothetical protein